MEGGKEKWETLLHESKGIDATALATVITCRHVSEVCLSVWLPVCNTRPLRENS